MIGKDPFDGADRLLLLQTPLYLLLMMTSTSAGARWSDSGDERAHFTRLSTLQSNARRLHRRCLAPTNNRTELNDTGQGTCQN